MKEAEGSAVRPPTPPVKGRDFSVEDEARGGDVFRSQIGAKNAESLGCSKVAL